MKRKPAPNTEPVLLPVDPIPAALSSFREKELKKPSKCVVCGEDTSPNSHPGQDEDLCWVCRRLKLSAWRDSDTQMPAQE